MPVSATTRASSRSSKPLRKDAIKAPEPGVSPAVSAGQAAGLRLAQSAADVMLCEYSNRPSDGTVSASSERWSAAWDALHAALGVMASDPDVATALHDLDGAHGDELVEYEDRTWHAAWTAAMGLKGGC